VKKTFCTLGIEGTPLSEEGGGPGSDCRWDTLPHGGKKFFGPTSEGTANGTQAGQDKDIESTSGERGRI